jgi:hypothetical protein
MYDWDMSQGHPLPLPGYRALASYDCPECDRLVHVVYAGEGPLSAAATYAWKSLTFTGGVALTLDSHWPRQYSYGLGCGFFVAHGPERLDYWRRPHGREAFVQQLYATLLPYNGQVKQRIVAFDVDAFMAAPFIRLAPAREPNRAPIALIADAQKMGQLIVGQPQGLSTADQQRAAALFLKMIRAKTRPIVGA